MKEELENLLISQEQLEELTEITYDEIKYGITPQDLEILTESELTESDKEDKIERKKEKSSFDLEIKKLKNYKFPFYKKIYSLVNYILFSFGFFLFLSQIVFLIFDLFFDTDLFLNIDLFLNNLRVLIFPLIFIAWMGFDINKSEQKKNYQKRRQKLRRLESLKQLNKLWNEVDNYNKIIRSIDVKDQISNILEKETESGREEILQSMEKIHDNLIKAIKIDKIIRENEDVISIERESLELTFAELKYTEMKDQASKYSDLVDEILDLGKTLNSEFEELQSSSTSFKESNSK